jgi:hypothetical protein
MTNEAATKTYSAKSAAVRAARSALGAEAIPGIDFNLHMEGKGWTWAVMPQNLPQGTTQMTLGDISALAGHDEEEGQMPSGVAAAGLDEAMGGPLAQEAPASDKAKAAPPVKTKRKTAKFAALEEAAARGELPPEPDFSVETHKRFRPKLAQVVEMAKKGDLKGLKAFSIPAISTSPKAIMRYRDFAILAIRARSA